MSHHVDPTTTSGATDPTDDLQPVPTATVDEHATGVLSATGRATAEHGGLEDELDLSFAIFSRSSDPVQLDGQLTVSGDVGRELGSLPAAAG